MIFVDTDVFLDLAWNREPFSYATADLLMLVENKKIEIGTTPVVLTNIFYLLSSKNSSEIATSFLLKLTKLVQIIPITAEDNIAGLKSEFQDKEDAINHYAAFSAKCTLIVSRNKRDFAHSIIPVLTAEEYLLMEFPFEDYAKTQ